MTDEIDVRPGSRLPLVSLTEIAQRAGVQKPAVAMWRVRHETFPEPVAEPRCGPIFWWPHVKAWLNETGRAYDANLSVEEVNVNDRKRSSRTIG